MKKRALTKTRLCKKFGDDIWGNFSRSNKIEKINLTHKFNGYLRRGNKNRLDNTNALRIDIKDPRVQVKRKTAFGRMLIMKQKFRYFYGILKEYQFKNLFMKAAYRYLSKFPYFALMSFYESRLDSILYRSNFIISPMEGRQWINYGLVYVNGNPITKASYRVSLFDIVSVSKSLSDVVKNNLNSQMKKKYWGDFQTSHLEICHRGLRIVYIGNLNVSALFFPFKFDYRKLFNIYGYR